MTTSTEIDLTAAEIASQQGVTVQAFNTWKRLAALKQGKSYGSKRGRAYYFTPQEVQEILLHGKSNEADYPNPPQQVYESEDVEACQDSSFMVLAQSSNALIHDLQAVLALAQSQEQALIETASRYLHPSNRRARILNGIAQKLQGSSGESISATLAIAFNQPPALPPRPIQPEFRRCPTVTTVLLMSGLSLRTCLDNAFTVPGQVTTAQMCFQYSFDFHVKTDPAAKPRSVTVLSRFQDFSIMPNRFSYHQRYPLRSKIQYTIVLICLLGLGLPYLPSITISIQSPAYAVPSGGD